METSWLKELQGMLRLDEAKPEDFKERCSAMSARGGVQGELAQEMLSIWSAMDQVEEKVEKALRGEF